jgi:hypothetical protein
VAQLPVAQCQSTIATAASSSSASSLTDSVQSRVTGFYGGRAGRGRGSAPVATGRKEKLAEREEMLESKQNIATVTTTKHTVNAAPAYAMRFTDVCKIRK